jgi:lysophospholipase L1-like esterase
MAADHRRPFARTLPGRIPLCVAACLTLGASRVHAQVSPADTGRFGDEIAQFEQHDRTAPPPHGAVLFVGSSSIRMWCTLDRDFPELKVINRGFGGSEMSDVVHYASRVVIPYAPRTIVVYAGDNDLASGHTPAQVHEAFQRFAAIVHQQLPATRLVYIAIKPSTSRVKLLAQTRTTNALLRADARRDSLVTYADVYTPMLGRSGAPRAELFGADGLHMNSSGYAIWRTVLAPMLATTR